MGRKSGTQYKYRLYNLETNESSNWVSVYSIGEFYEMDKSNLYQAIKEKRPVKIKGVKHRLEKINTPPPTTQYKYRLYNLETDVCTDWVSVYRLRKVYGINEENFFYAMRKKKPINIGGMEYRLVKINPDDGLDSIMEEVGELD